MVSKWFIPVRAHAQTISHLSNRFNSFTQKNYAIYVIDDYAVHLMPETRKAFFQRGYILVVMGGGITGFIQANDTHYHRKLKSYYRDLEMELMLEKLQVERNKVPTPTREEMVNITVKAEKKFDVNFSEVFKQHFVTNGLNGSKDYLVSDILFDLIGEEMKDFRKTLLDSNTPNTIQELIRKIIPPKGIRRKNIERVELLDFSVEEVSFEPEEPDDVDPISEEENESEVDDPPELEIDQSENVSDNRNRLSSLVGVSNDIDINKDARFLEVIENVLADNETSMMLKPFGTKIKMAFVDERRSVKRRICDCNWTRTQNHLVLKRTLNHLAKLAK